MESGTGDWTLSWYLSRLSCSRFLFLIIIITPPLAWSKVLLSINRSSEKLLSTMLKKNIALHNKIWGHSSPQSSVRFSFLPPPFLAISLVWSLVFVYPYAIDTLYFLVKSARINLDPKAKKGRSTKKKKENTEDIKN